MNNLIHKKEDVYFVLGSFYQSNLSNTSNIDIDKVATLTNNNMYAVSYKLRPTYSFTKIQNLLDLSKCKEPAKGEQLPLFVPLGLFVLESYPFLQNKMDSMVICFEFEKNDQPEQTLYAAITIHKGSIYCMDGKGEFVGNSNDLILYLKEIIQKLKIRDIHSTVECFQLIEDTFLNQEINFKKIGLGKNKEFEFDSSILFWDKRYKSICEKINFTKIFTKKEKRKKQVKILSVILSGIALISIGGGGAYYYFKEDVPPPPPPKPAPVYVKLFSYDSLIKDCFDRAAYFLADKGNWGLASYNCDFKNGGVLKFLNYGDGFNNIVNSEDFVKSYNLLPSESKAIMFSSSNTGNGKVSSILLNISIKDKGIEQTKYKPISKEMLRSKIIELTTQAEGGDFDLNVNTDKLGTVSKLEITSPYSPITLENKYKLFSDLYIEKIMLKIDDKTAATTWTITMDVKTKQNSSQNNESKTNESQQK